MSELIQGYFGKENLEEIELSDIQRYFETERTESNKIEYKSFVVEGDTVTKKQKRENETAVLETICSFLNSEGGILIWGAPKGSQPVDREEKVFIGSLTGLPMLYEKDAMISKITDSITPSPKGILFHSVEFESKYIYFIVGEKSEYAPHQYKDKYYMRLDGQTRVAPHHYIEALFRKISYPKLQCFILPESIDPQGTSIEFRFSIIIFNISRLLNEHDISYTCISPNGRFPELSDIWEKTHYERLEDGHELRRENVKETLHYGEFYEEEKTIDIPISRLNEDETITVNLHVAGKFSPLISSRYKFKVTGPYPDEINNTIIIKEENKYLFEYRDESGESDQEMISNVLGRSL